MVAALKVAHIVLQCVSLESMGISADDDEDALLAQLDEQVQEQVSEEKMKKASKSRGKNKEGSDAAVSDECYAFSCKEPLKKRSKWCA